MKLWVNGKYLLVSLTIYLPIFTFSWKEKSWVKPNYKESKVSKEKYFFIEFSHEDISLNKKSELISKFWDENKNLWSVKRDKDSMD